MHFKIDIGKIFLDSIDENGGDQRDHGDSRHPTETYQQGCKHFRDDDKLIIFNLLLHPLLVIFDKSWTDDWVYHLNESQLLSAKFQLKGSFLFNPVSNSSYN